jgi:hypothetical protein
MPIGCAITPSPSSGAPLWSDAAVIIVTDGIQLRLRSTSSFIGLKMPNRFHITIV